MPNLPNFKERFKPPQMGLVEADRNKDYTVETYFKEQIGLLKDMILSIRNNIQPEFDPSFAPKFNIIAPDTVKLDYETRMFQFVVHNPSSAILRVGYGVGGNTSLPNRFDIPVNRIFVSPVFNFSNISLSYATVPTPFALAFVFAYNRIMHTPGMYSLA